MRSKAKVFNWRQSPLNCFQYKFSSTATPMSLIYLKEFAPGCILRKGDCIFSVNLPEREETLKMPFSGKITDCDVKLEGGNWILFNFEKCQHVPIQGENKFDICEICGDELFSYEEKEVIQYRKWDFKQIKNMEAPIEWNVAINQQFTKGKVLGVCDEQELMLDFTGRIVYLDDPKDRNLPILKIRKTVCLHQRIKDSICLQCGKQVTVQKTSITVQPNGIINTGRLLEKLQMEFVTKLKTAKKLILILDLDNTILHAISTYFGDTIDFDVGDALVVKSEFVSYIVKLRPFFREFLKNILPKFDVYIYTKGTRSYAERICEYIRQKYKDLLSSPEYDDFFTPKRITSRDQDTSLTKKSLYNIIQGHQNMILILDDRKDVWQQCRKNVITTRQYLYYDRQETRVFLLRRRDFYLHFTTHFLNDIHKYFYNFVLKETDKDVRSIVKLLQKLRMANIKAFFLFLQLKTNPIYVRGINQGMIDVNDWQKNTPDIFIFSQKFTHRDYEAVLKTGIPVVHQLWIEYCYVHNFLFKRTMFEINNGDTISGHNTEEREEFDKKLFEEHKLSEDAFLQY